MNREIKFRFWDNDENEMINWNQISPLRREYFAEKSELIPMQFTGIKDKKGVEIYEGDILSTPNKGVGTVKWMECGFVLVLQSETVWQNLLWNVIRHYTIEGNIHENPELLK